MNYVLKIDKERYFPHFHSINDYSLDECEKFKEKLMNAKPRTVPFISKGFMPGEFARFDNFVTNYGKCWSFLYFYQTYLHEINYLYQMKKIIMEIHLADPSRFTNARDLAKSRFLCNLEFDLYMKYIKNKYITKSIISKNSNNIFETFDTMRDKNIFLSNENIKINISSMYGKMLN